MLRNKEFRKFVNRANIPKLIEGVEIIGRKERVISRNPDFSTFAVDLVLPLTLSL